MDAQSRPLWTVCLDLEGTLISTAVSQIPRPGLNEFLDALIMLPVRLWLFTSVPEDRVREILRILAEDSLIPPWADSLPIVPWARTATNKRLDSVPSSEVPHTLLVDDMPVLAPEHRTQWVPIAPFDGTTLEDTELQRVLGEIRRRIRSAAR